MPISIPFRFPPQFSISTAIVSLVQVCLSCVAGGTETGNDFFEAKIRPVLVKHCYECHSANTEVSGGLRLDSREVLLRGGESGEAIVPGEPAKSLLIKALKYEDLKMPPTGKLDDKVVGDFEKWIEIGAPDPRETTPASSAPQQVAIDWEDAVQFWSFRPPVRHPSPMVKQSDWVKQPIDLFVLSALESRQLSPNEPADKRTWLQRVSLDLTGLAATYQEVQDFEGDDSPEAEKRVVDRLLGSVHFGERWARLWLDLARYAEDQAHIVGDDKSLFYPNAYLYRDWVIQAFNDDLPYDQFVRLQLAADLIEPDDPTNHLALGFMGLGPKYYRRNAPDVMADEWEDRVDTLTRGLLGLTVACARCHDHKYDPVPTEDYYALAGVFAGVEMFNRPISSTAETNDKGQAKDPENAVHIIRDGKPRDLRIMVRGDVNNEGELVPRGFVRALTGGSRTPFVVGSGRVELAQAVTSSDNPLIARVIVNRLWGEMFGQPLVATPSNFGRLGTPPSHPELLDDLSVRFMDNGWSMKWLLRELALSATYRQSSRRDLAKFAIDPSNTWLWRANRKRLSVESWRDRLLDAAGRLHKMVGGKSIKPSDPQQSRRTVYSYISRFQLDPLLSLLDFPDPNTHAERRSLTTTPLQKLFALNSPFLVQRGTEVAQHVIELPVDSLGERVRALYQRVLARHPDEDELQLAVTYVDSRGDDRKGWEELAQVILASNELLFVD